MRSPGSDYKKFSITKKLSLFLFKELEKLRVPVGNELVENELVENELVENVLVENVLVENVHR